MNLLKTLASISGMTMLSRITGLMREIQFANSFGVSTETDAFNVAFRIPNLLRRLFAEGAFSQAFVPILAEYKSQQGSAATKTLVDHVATTLVWTTLLTCILGIIGSPLLIYFIATGLAKRPGAVEASVDMTRIMFPYIIFMSFVALSGGVLNTWREFKIPAFTPVLLNVSFILTALFLAPHLAHPVYAMAIGVFIGGVLQISIQVPALKKIGMLPHISFNPLSGLRDAGVRRILKKMGPAIFAVSAAPISLMINTNIASRLPDGNISWLSYADRLMEFPIALLGVALGTILLPSLSKANVEGDKTEYSALLDWGLRLTFLLALPAAVGLATLAEPLIATLFQRGKFTALDVTMTAKPLIAYSVGLIGIVLVKILSPAFYARQDIRTPVKIAIGVLIATQIMNWIFVPQIGVAGLALSIGMGACLNAGLLFWGLRSSDIYVPHGGWLAFFVKLAIALLIMGAVSSGLNASINFTGMHTFQRCGALLLIIMACMFAYFGALFAMGFRFRDFRRVSI